MHTLAIAMVLVGGAGIASAGTSKPKLTLTNLTATGAIDAKAVLTVVKRSAPKLLACFTRASSPATTITATFTIAADGTVTDATPQAPSSAAHTCIGSALAKLEFGKPTDGQPVKVRIPIRYEPSAEDPVQGGAFASLTGTGEISSGEVNSIGDVTGPGGGGTGWGTIGTGRYGVIGQGRGTGTGYGIGGSGGMRGRANGPSVKIGQPGATGSLDKAIIRRYIRRNIQKLTYCYEKELLTTPGIKGTVTVDFRIDTDGKVSASKASGINTEVETCVAGVVKSIEFPKPKGGDVTVKYPFTFQTTDDAKK
jgi:hypothetical protein